MKSGGRYGTWAVIAGASEGLGAAFAEAVARRGYDVVVVARRVEKLEDLALGLRERHGVRAVAVALDLAASDVGERLLAQLGDREVGLLVFNAAYAPLGAFLDVGVDDALQAVDVNCRAPLLLLHALVPGMVARGRGGVVLMSSLTAFQGTPWTTVYGATKAFNLSLGEGLWLELAERGVDVVVCAAGATRTPNYLARAAKGGAPGELEPAQVAEEALEGLGSTALVIPGRFNRAASWLMRRVLTRRAAVRILEGQTRKLRAGG